MLGARLKRSLPLALAACAACWLLGGGEAVGALVARARFGASDTRATASLRPAIHRVLPPRMADPPMWKLKLGLGKAGTANLRMKPLLSGSEPVVVRYDLPFGLNVENKDGRAVCTKAGPGGEQEGDILRYTTAWSIGMPDGDGIGTTAASFSGAGIGWKVSLFNVATAKSWQEVVEALTSNTPERTDKVTLVFERPKLASAAFVVEPRRDAAALLDTAALLDALRRTTTAVPTFASRLGVPVMSSAVDDVIGKLESMTVDEVMEKLKSEAEAGSMTLLEAKELVQAIEKTFDVDASAGAAVMMAAPMPGAAGAGDAPAAEEKTEFDLVLEAFPADKKIAVLKIVRELTGAGLKDAKEMVEKAPCTLKEGASKAECEEAKAKLEEAGATVQLK